MAVNTESNTTEEPQVDVILLKLVAQYCEAERKIVQSKYFPLVEKAIEMFEQGLEQKDIMKQFRLAFAKANGLEPGAYDKDPEYVTFRLKTAMFVRIAKEGRPWYDRRREAKVGFFSMYELAKQVSGEEEDNEEPSTAAKAKAKGKAKANPKAKAKTETEAEKENAEPLADREWFGKCKLIVKDEPDNFIKMISGLIDKGLLPDTILEPIKAHLRGD